MDIVIKVTHFPKVGETIMGESYFTAPGGKGANQAVAAANLGADIYLVGAVGKDAHGDELIETSKTAGVKLDYITRLDEHTGTAYITLDTQGANNIIVIPGANGKLSEKHIQSALDQVQENDIVIAQLEISVPLVQTIFQKAREKKAITFLNPSPIDNFIPELLENTDVLVMNEIEAQHIAKTEDMQKASTTILGMGSVEHTIITLGENGVIYSNKEKQLVTIPAFKVQAVDTTAAGDSFIGGLATARQQGKNWIEALTYASAVGAKTTTKLGAQPSLPTKEEVDQLLAK